MKRLALFLLFGMLLMVIPQVNYGNDLPVTSTLQVGVPPGAPQTFIYQAPAVQPLFATYDVRESPAVEYFSQFEQADIKSILVQNLFVLVTNNQLKRDATYVRILYNWQYSNHLNCNFNSTLHNRQIETYATLMFVKYRCQSF